MGLRRLSLVTLVFLASVFAAAQAPVLKLPTAHTAWINNFALSHNGKWIATCSYDNTIKIWDHRTGRELKVLTGHKAAVNAIRFSPNDSLLLSGSADTDLRLWNLSSGECVRVLDTLFGRSVTDVAFSPDGKKVGGCSNNGLVVYDLSLNKMLLDVRLDSRGTRVQFHPGGEKIACTQADSLLAVWSFKDSAVYVQKESFYYIHGPVNDFFYSRDGSMIFAAVDGIINNIRVRIMGVKDSIRFRGHLKPALAICPGETDDVFYSMSMGSSASRRKPLVEIRKWSLSRRKIIDSFELEDRANTAPRKALAVDRQGRVAYVNSSTVSLAQASAPHLQEKIQSHTSIVNGIMVAGTELITTSEDGVIRFMDLKTNRLETVSAGADIIASHFSSGRRWLTLALRQHTDSGYTALVVRYDLLQRTRKTLLEIPNASIDGLTGLAVSDDGNHFALSVIPMAGGVLQRDSTRFQVWDAQNKKLILNKSAAQIWDISFLPGTTDIVLATGLSNKLFLVRADTIVSFQDTLVAAKDRYFDVAPIDPQRLVATYGQGVDVWNMATKKLETRIPVFTGQGGYVSLFLSADKKKMTLIRDDTARILDLKTRILSKPFIAGLSWFNCASYSNSAHMLVTSGIDNSIRFWDEGSGHEKYELVYIDSSDHLFFTPQGYYQSSRAAAQQVHYATHDMRIISFEQLDVRQNRPDLVLQAIGAADPKLVLAYHKAWTKRLRRLGLDTNKLASELSVPEADFVGRDLVLPIQKNRRLSLRIRASDKELALDRMNLWVNECPIFGARGIRLRPGRHGLDTLIQVTLSEGVNVLETSVFNTNGTESYRSPLTVFYGDPEDKGRLHFIGIGIDRFRDSSNNLNYSVKDLRDLAKVLKDKYNDRITIDTLFNEKVTVAHVQLLKRKLLQGSVDDRVILSYSGHGLLNSELDYFLSTYNVNFAKPEQGGLPYEVLESLLDSIPSRRKLLLIDACHSGEVDKEEVQRYKAVAKTLPVKGAKGIEMPGSGSKQVGIKNSFELMQELFVDVARTTGATVISAAAGTQLAREGGGSVENGVFTYAILEFLKARKEGTVNDLKRYVNWRVPELTKGLQVPTSRAENKVVDWKIW
jgi:WD40 repeat protein